MKKLFLIFCWLFLVIIACSSAQISLAQDPVQVGPNLYKVLFENEKVRVCDVRFKPGDKIGIHSHPDHLVYVLSPGTIKIIQPNGAGQEINAKAGEVIWSKAETHQTVNTGKTEVHLVLVELKETKAPPAK